MVPTTRRDSIDRFIEASLALFPGVDPETEGVIDRIHKRHNRRVSLRTRVVEDDFRAHVQAVVGVQRSEVARS